MRGRLTYLRESAGQRESGFGARGSHHSTRKAWRLGSNIRVESGVLMPFIGGFQDYVAWYDAAVGRGREARSLASDPG